MILCGFALTLRLCVKLLLGRAGLAGELRKFGWSKRNVVLRVDQQAISRELEIKCRIERRFVENDLYGEDVWRSPGATGGS